MKSLQKNFCVACFLLASIAPALAQEYDLVITNGRVMDPETKLDAIRNVGIIDGRIEVVTDTDITGKETIDPRGHVVAPGFIDFHMHGQDPYSIKIALRDGVTTPLELEVAPIRSTPTTKHVMASPRRTTVPRLATSERVSSS